MYYSYIMYDENFTRELDHGRNVSFTPYLFIYVSILFNSKSSKNLKTVKNLLLRNGL